MPKSRALREQIGVASEQNPNVHEGQIDTSIGTGPLRQSLVGQSIREELGAKISDKTKAAISEKLGIDQTSQEPTQVREQIEIGPDGEKKRLGYGA